MLKEPNFTTLPTVEDFYYDGDCDERYAIKTYYGKDIDFAEKQYYISTPLGVVQDFIFIGTKAFCYYIFGAFRYLQNDTANLDIDDATEVYCALVDILRAHLRRNAKDMYFIVDYIKEFLNWAVKNYDMFNVNEKIYGNVKEEYKKLAQEFECQAHCKNK